MRPVPSAAWCPVRPERGSGQTPGPGSAGSQPSACLCRRHAWRTELYTSEKLPSLNIWQAREAQTSRAGSPEPGSLDRVIGKEEAAEGGRGAEAWVVGAREEAAGGIGETGPGASTQPDPKMSGKVLGLRRRNSRTARSMGTEGHERESLLKQKSTLET